MHPSMEELRRRNVFRVGAAYAIAAWLVLQVPELLASKDGQALVASR
jgi:hypothetical protein